MDSSEGAVDLTILKPSFLKKRPWTKESIYRTEIWYFRFWVTLSRLWCHQNIIVMFCFRTSAVNHSRHLTLFPNSDLQPATCKLHPPFSWFVLTLELSARLQNTRQYTCSDWKTLENQSANLQANSGREGILLKHVFFFSEEGFKVRTALSLLIVNDPCQLPSVTFDMSLRPTVTHT